MRRVYLEKIWRERFSRFAKTYNEDHLIAGWSQEGLKKRLEKYVKIITDLELPYNIKILDAGCGPGTYCRTLKNLNYQNIIGIDYSWPVLKKAKERSPRVIYINANIYQLPFKKNIFDHILCIGVLQSISDELNLIKELKRVLKPNGILVIGILNKDELYYKIKKRKQASLDDVRRYSIIEFRNKLENQHFEILGTEYIVILPNMLRWLPSIFFRNRWFAHSIFYLCRKKYAS